MRSYKQYCGVAKALDVIGQRWALLIVRDLLPGPQRFQDLRVPGLTPNVLSTRLQELSNAGLVESVVLAPPAARKAWRLTEAGRRLEPVVFALGAFGSAYLGAPDDDTLCARWMLISLQRRYTGGLSMVVNVVVDDAPYVLDITPDRLTTRDGRAPAADLTLSGPMMPIAGLLVRGLRSPEVTVVGAGLDRFLAVLGGLVAHESGTPSP